VAVELVVEALVAAVAAGLVAVEAPAAVEEEALVEVAEAEVVEVEEVAEVVEARRRRHHRGRTSGESSRHPAPRMPLTTCFVTTPRPGTPSTRARGKRSM